MPIRPCHASNAGFQSLSDSMPRLLLSCRKKNKAFPYYKASWPRLARGFALFAKVRLLASRNRGPAIVLQPLHEHIPAREVYKPLPHVLLADATIPRPVHNLQKLDRTIVYRPGPRADCLRTTKHAPSRKAGPMMMPFVIERLFPS